MWKIHGAHGHIAGVLVRNPYFVCDHGYQVFPDLQHSFLGVSADLVYDGGGADGVAAADGLVEGKNLMKG